MNHRRRDMCKEDLPLFLLTYFPERFSAPFSDKQFEAVEAVESTILRGGSDKSVSLDRGEGKSSYCIFSALWSAIYQHRDYVLILALDLDRADWWAATLRDAIASDAIFADFRSEIAGLLIDAPTHVKSPDSWGHLQSAIAVRGAIASLPMLRSNGEGPLKGHPNLTLWDDAAGSWRGELDVSGPVIRFEAS